MVLRWRWLLLLLCLLGFASAAHAQQELPEPIPDTADPLFGVEIYQQRCANCHGPLGLGDGPLAANLENPPPPIGDPAYLAGLNPADLFLTIQNGRITAGMPGFGVGNNSDPLSEAQIWDVVAGLYQLDLLTQPLETAVITGQVSNGSGGGLPEGLNAILQAFDSDFAETLRLETPLTAAGTYQFDLSLVPPGWIYRTVVTYDGLDFTSIPTRLDPFAPQADLPVTVYNTTQDDSSIVINQLELIVEFGEGVVQVAELYTISQNEAAVYVGESGRLQDGTLFFSLPANAEQISLLRGFGGPTDFVPLSGVVRDSEGVRPPLPVAPGEATMQLLLRYELPFERTLTLQRPLSYPAGVVTAVVPDTGVVMQTAGESGWEPTASLPAGDTLGLPRNRYLHDAVGRGETVSLSLSGWPREVLNASGNLVVNRDEQTELWIGLGALIVVAAVVGYVGYRWRTSPPPVNDRDDLLVELAALDEAFAAGQLRKSIYQQRRTQLKERLISVWE